VLMFCKFQLGMLKNFLVAAISLFSSGRAWSVPGLIPKNYEKLQKLDVFVG
jgi:Endomembrane protein 70